jgi:NRPS condensation-like uncharacterized protein
MYVWRNVEPVKFHKVVQYGRVHDATLDDMLVAAYSRALYAALKPAERAKTPVQVSWDLRPLLPGGTRVGLANLSATWSVNVVVDPSETFVGTLLEVAQQTAEARGSGWPSATAVGMVLADRLNRKKPMETGLNQSDVAGHNLAHGRGYPGVADLGVIADEYVNFGPMVHAKSAYGFGPIAFPGGFMLTASVFHDCLRLSAGIDRSATDVKLAQAIVEGVAQELEGAVS